MTGYTVHTGSSERFATGWDQIFSSKSTKKEDGSKPKKKSSAKAKAKSKKKKSSRKEKSGK